MSTNAVQRSLAHLRRAGYLCGVVERYIRFGDGDGVRVDLFNFADIVAVHPQMLGTLYIQCCPASTLAEHRKKLLTPPVCEHVRMCLQSRNEVRIDAWGLYGQRGKRKRWEVRQEWIELHQLPKGGRDVL